MVVVLGFEDGVAPDHRQRRLEPGHHVVVGDRVGDRQLVLLAVLPERRFGEALTGARDLEVAVGDVVAVLPAVG